MTKKEKIVSEFFKLSFITAYVSVPMVALSTITGMEKVEPYVQLFCTISLTAFTVSYAFSKLWNIKMIMTTEEKKLKEVA